MVVGTVCIPLLLGDRENSCGGLCGMGGEGSKCESEAANLTSGDQEYIFGTIVMVIIVCSPLLLGDRS